MDKILITGIQAFGHHGHSAEEREVGQVLEADVELTTDVSRAGISDDLADTDDWSKVYQTVVNQIEQGTQALLEKLAEDIACRILSETKAEKALIRLRKPNPPIGGICASVGVEIERGRDEIKI